jgi:hypothetical protein
VFKQGHAAFFARKGQKNDGVPCPPYPPTPKEKPIMDKPFEMREWSYIDPATLPRRSEAEMRRILLKGWDGDGDPEEFIEMKKKGWQRALTLK